MGLGFGCWCCCFCLGAAAAAAAALGPAVSPAAVGAAVVAAAAGAAAAPSSAPPLLPPPGDDDDEVEYKAPFRLLPPPPLLLTPRNPAKAAGSWCWCWRCCGSSRAPVAALTEAAAARRGSTRKPRQYVGRRRAMVAARIREGRGRRLLLLLVGMLPASLC